MRTLTPKELNAIQLVANRLAHKYKFGYYDIDDIKQEIFLIAIECIDRHDCTKSSLETFLYIHVNNRLKNFKRDRYYRHAQYCQKCVDMGSICDNCYKSRVANASKKNLMDTIDIDSIRDVDHESHMSVYLDLLDHLETKEIRKLIDDNLSINMREDYLRLVDGAYVPQHRKKRLEEAIKEIMENNGYL